MVFWVRKSFTLVELLVAVGILAILLTIVIVSINIPKQMITVRDLRRKIDVKELADSLSAFYTDQRNLPPQDLWYSLICESSQVPPSLAPFMSSFSCDPKSHQPYYYEALDVNCQPCSDAVCQKFRILTTLENPDDQSIPSVGCDSQIGCGPYNEEGQPYNYGTSLGCPLKSDNLAWQTAKTAYLKKTVPLSGKILEAQFAFNTSSSPELLLSGLVQKNGYSKTPTVTTPEYKIIFLDSNGSVFYSADFSSPKAVGFEIEENSGPVNQSNFVLTLPWYDQLSEIRVENQAGDVIASAPVSEVVIQNNSPSFYTIPGSQLAPQSDATTGFQIIPPVRAATDDSKIDLVFIGDGFTTQSSLVTYHDNINRFIKELLTIEPFRSRASDFNFHYVDVTQNFNCYGYPNFYNCLGPVTSAANTAGVPWDNIYVVVNNTSYGGAAYYDGIAYGSVCSLGPLIYVHELGHSFGLLADEYIASNSYENSNKNCYQGQPPNSAWNGIVSPSDYVQGCNYSSWYRSSGNSIMRSLDAPYFNPISQKYINDEINHYLGTQITPTLVPAPSATPTPVNSCPNPPQLSLQYPDMGSVPVGGKFDNTIYVTNTNPVTCSSDYYLIADEWPFGWDLTSPTFIKKISGGTTIDWPFSYRISPLETPGTHTYKLKVFKQFNGQNIEGKVSGVVEVVSSAVTPSPTLQPTSVPVPTPTQTPCLSGYTVSLAKPTLSGQSGQTVSQTLSVTNNNDYSCGSANFAISHAEPSGFTILNLPPSVNLFGGQTQNIDFTVTIPSNTQTGDYLTQFWINGGNPYNSTISVTYVPVPTPSLSLFSNMSVRSYGDYALFKFSYANWGLGDFRVDVATDRSALNQTVGPNSYARYGFAFGSGTPMDPSNQATPASIRGVIQKTPQSWDKWTCGTTIYWRMYNSSDLTISSPIQQTAVDCTTQINILPWDAWYSAIYYGVYDSRYDADNNGVVNWYDYWILVDQTRLR